VGSRHWTWTLNVHGPHLSAWQKSWRSVPHVWQEPSTASSALSFRRSLRSPTHVPQPNVSWNLLPFQITIHIPYPSHPPLPPALRSRRPGHSSGSVARSVLHLSGPWGSWSRLVRPPPGSPLLLHTRATLPGSLAPFASAPLTGGSPRLVSSRFPALPLPALRHLIPRPRSDAHPYHQPLRHLTQLSCEYVTLAQQFALARTPSRVTA
jgi:hypothetical protein